MGARQIQLTRMWIASRARRTSTFGGHSFEARRCYQMRLGAPNLGLAWKLVGKLASKAAKDLAHEAAHEADDLEAKSDLTIILH
jgi:hypothetical protein